MAARVGRFDDALAFARRALTVDPSASAHHLALAQLSAQRRAWPEAVDACRAALRLNPADLSARRLLVLSLVQLGDRSAARAESQIYLGFDPPDRDRFTPLPGAPP
jgi:Flp pilus assembly protein TadD